MYPGYKPGLPFYFSSASAKSERRVSEPDSHRPCVPVRVRRNVSECVGRISESEGSLLLLRSGCCTLRVRYTYVEKSADEL